MIYGDRTEKSIESAIKIMILMLVFIFDPMAICLLIAAQLVYAKKVEQPEPTIKEAVELEETIAEPEEILEEPKADIASGINEEAVEEVKSMYESLDEIQDEFSAVRLDEVRNGSKRNP